MTMTLSGPPWVGGKQCPRHWTDDARGDRWEDVRNPEYPKTLRGYGKTGGKQGPGLAWAQLSHAYDVTNGMGLSAVLDRYDASGRGSGLVEHLGRLRPGWAVATDAMAFRLRATLELRQGLLGLSLLHPARARFTLK